VIPDSALKRDVGNSILLRRVYGQYDEKVAMSRSDKNCLTVLMNIDALAQKKMGELSYEWAQDWVISMKREQKLKPDTIKHYVGALARMLDWARKLDKDKGGIPFNPLRELGRKYSKYTETDLEVSGLTEEEATATERDRRLEGEEEKKILEAIDQHAESERERLEDRTFFLLALESAMRMREIYTLAPAQVSVAKRTIFLDKTKNGSKRQVPMSTVAVTLMDGYKPHSKTQVFSYWSGSLKIDDLENDTSIVSKKFARYFELAGCPDFRFHDTRHEATSRIFERTNLRETEIMKITGHKSTRMLARYSNLRASNLAVSLW
jgi:integrase